jgi:septal ring factor EnvC (AmiA/AmiB activator)
MKTNKISLIIILFITLVLCLSNSSFSQSTSSLKKKEAQLKEQIEQTKVLIYKTQSAQNNSLSELNIINKQISYREELLNNLNSQLNSISNYIDENSSEIVIIRVELEKLKAEFKEMIRFAYKNRNKDFNMMYLIASENFNEAYQRMRYIQQYSENRKLQVKKIKTAQEKLVSKNELLVKKKSEKLNVIESSNTEKASFLADKNKQQTILKEVENNKASLIKKLQDQEIEKDKIAQAIKEAIKKEIAKNKEKNKPKITTDKPKTFTTSPEVSLAGKKFEENKGKLPWPVSSGVITSNYGRQQHSVVSTAFIENNGVDISTTKSADVRVVFNGAVSSILTIPGAGKAVIVSHGNYRTVYANLQEVNVSIGQKITTKQKVGNLLPNSSDKISESHFEIWEITSSDMKTVNPASWLVKK